MTLNPELQRNELLLEQFKETRKRTLELVKNLENDDFVVQTASYMSPPKWHIGHVSWIYEAIMSKLDKNTIDIKYSIQKELTEGKELKELHNLIDISDNNDLYTIIDLLKNASTSENINESSASNTKKNKKVQDLIKSRDDLTSYEDLEKEFQEIAYNEYFKAHPIIFIGSQDTNSNETGRIYAIMNVKKEDIRIHQVTSSTIKPGILIKKIGI